MMYIKIWVNLGSDLFVELYLNWLIFLIRLNLRKFLKKNVENILCILMILVIMFVCICEKIIFIFKNLMFIYWNLFVYMFDKID